MLGHKTQRSDPERLHVRGLRLRMPTQPDRQGCGDVSQQPLNNASEQRAHRGELTPLALLRYRQAEGASPAQSPTRGALTGTAPLRRDGENRGQDSTGTAGTGTARAGAVPSSSRLPPALPSLPRPPPPPPPPLTVRRPNSPAPRRPRPRAPSPAAAAQWHPARAPGNRVSCSR